jgi:fatty-acyl-CoA synthase
MLEHFQKLTPNAANFVPLSPVSFLRRAADVYADRRAVAYGGVQRTWSQTAAHCRAIAAGLARLGIGPGDTVSVLLPNIPELFELHFAVPLTGAILNTINVRLEPATVAYILDHADSRMVIADSTFAPLLSQSFEIMKRTVPVIEVVDLQAGSQPAFGGPNFESLVAPDSLHPWRLPPDEWAPLALNYTSGTAGRPKGVVYHHRGAYLMSMGTVAAWHLPQHPVYLSVVPMFHCNGWNHPWVMAIVGGAMVFTRDLAPSRLLRAIGDEGVTHIGAAPIVLQMIVDSPDAPAMPFDPVVKVLTAGAPPPPVILERAKRIGFEVMQVYGLTETYGHISQCLWQQEWDDLPPADQAEKQAMQGVAFPMVEELRVIDRATGRDVPRDATTQGEIAVRSNTIMMGYYKDPAATAAAFENGVFWSGDAAVVHADGYVQIRDRLKDVIISGGENISSVEVEAVLYRHPQVLAAAVVARAHPKWGESPCAFVELKPGQAGSSDEIVAFCRKNLAGFKVPKWVIFSELPKTATGKVQKFILRERAKQLD